jgi:chemotaxis protein CheD
VVKEIFLHPGEYAVGDAGCRISTLLGSCVAITLWHPDKKIGAMSHFLLPTQGRRLRDKPGCYGDEVIGVMLEALARMGVAASACEAKVFGGGNMFPQQVLDRRNVGHQNGEMARQMLLLHRIPIVSESLYGTGHRKIVFDVGSGDVWERRVEVPRADAGEPA